MNTTDTTVPSVEEATEIIFNGILGYRQSKVCEESEYCRKLNAHFITTHFYNEDFIKVLCPGKAVPVLPCKYLTIMLDAGQGELHDLFPYLLTAYAINYNGNTVIKNAYSNPDDQVEGAGVCLLFPQNKVESDVSSNRKKLAKRMSRTFSLRKYGVNRNIPRSKYAELEQYKCVKNNDKQEAASCNNKQIHPQTMRTFLCDIYIFLTTILGCIDAEIVTNLNTLIHCINQIQLDTGFIDLLPRIRIIHFVLADSTYDDVVIVRNFLSGTNLLSIDSIAKAMRILKETIEKNSEEILGTKVLKQIPESEVVAAFLGDQYELTLLGEKLVNLPRDQEEYKQELGEGPAKYRVKRPAKYPTKFQVKYRTNLTKRQVEYRVKKPVKYPGDFKIMYPNEYDIIKAGFYSTLSMADNE